MRRPPGIRPQASRSPAPTPRERIASLRRGGADDKGLTLVELLLAFTALIVLMTIVGTALTTYLNIGNNVVSSYNATDQLLPSSIVLQRLIRSEVEPAPPSATNVPSPPFVMGSVGTFSTTFYANIGDPNGPAEIVMTSTAPALCTGCKFKTSRFAVTQYVACPKAAAGAPAGCPTSGPYLGCPFSTASANICQWSTGGKVLATVNGLVNGQTGLPNPATPIFTYNTLDPYAGTAIAGAGGAPNVATGLLPNFGAGTCAAPTPAGAPTLSNCLADNIQSVQVDLEVQVTGAPYQENSFVVYRLSSASYLYSPLVG
jgi:hypothetical protein